jgi:hypothetical protein
VLELLNLLLEMLPTVGVPVVTMIAMAIFIYRVLSVVNEQNTKRENDMMSQLTRFGDSLDSFNITLTKIDNRLEIVERLVDRQINQ